MDINNNQQVNTFVKCIYTDTSDMYIGEGSYRYAENLRVVTDGNSNSGELHIIEGTTKISDRDSSEQILGLTSIRNYEVEVIKHDDTWSIYRSTISEDNIEDRVLVAGPFTKQIWPNKWNGKTKPLSLVARWESNDNVKLYIANGITELLSINIAEENQGSDFEQLFQASTKILLPPTVTVTESKGAIIPGVVMQYGYIVYKKRGTASTLSILSHAVVSAVDKITGFGVDENSTNIINIQLPDNIVGKYVRLYRICYSRSGQLPRVDIIYDQMCQQTTINDVGQSIQNVSTAEFIATNKLSFVPKNIESKGDYIFAGNVLYNQDEIDSQFQGFDARCFSRGSYYVDNEQAVEIGVNASDELLQSVPINNIYNRQFDAALTDYDPEQWKAGYHGFNGHGLCFDWKYSYKQSRLTDNQQYQSDTVTPRTYARNEVYRFGVKLYDKEGRASSVKWIADIKMPDYFNPAGDETMEPYIEMQNGNRYVNNLSIQFVPRQSELWNGVYKYEIVQAKRGISDSYKIMQGISGYPMQVGEEQHNEICVPYYLTTQDFYVGRGMRYAGGWNYVGFDGFDEDWHYLHSHAAFLYPQDKNQLLFVSPEYAYQPDDINALMSEYKTSLYHHTVGVFAQIGNIYTKSSDGFNGADALFGSQDTTRPVQYIAPKNITSQDKGADLRVGIYGGDTNNPAGVYYLTSQIMNYCNYYSRPDADYDPKGGRYHDDDDRRKMAFFTSISPTDLLYVPEKNNIHIQNATPYKPASPEDIAKNEKCALRDKFTTLKNSKKFFNWTNPALLDTEVYEKLTSPYDDDVINSWKEQTMTAWNDWFVGLKYGWYAVDGSEWSRNRGRIGSQALSFPTSPGGGGIMLEAGSDTHTYFKRTIESFDAPVETSETEVVYSGTIEYPEIEESNITGVYSYKWTTPISFDTQSFSGTLDLEITFEDGTDASYTGNGTVGENTIILSARTPNSAVAQVIIYNNRIEISTKATKDQLQAIAYAFTPTVDPRSATWSEIQCPIQLRFLTHTYEMSLESGSYPMPPVTIANIYKPATPYGGYNVSAITQTQYVGEGYISDPDTPIVVSMGDNHITTFAYMLYHNFDHAQHDTITSAALQYIVPIESTMDLSKTCSNYIQATHSAELPIPGDGAWIQVSPNTNAGRFTQTTDLYLYNTAYSVNPDIVTYAAEDTINAVNSLFDYRIHYSQQKQNNELIDNWTSFKAIDYLDVDSRYGQITGLKLFKDKLIFLQENGAGVLSVNDRIILKDQNSANIIVGNGGVLDRYDYFTTIYGMKPDQHAVEASNDSLYWWDGYRKEIISYTDGYNVNLLQRIKNVADYINNRDESETPSILYDVDNKEVLFNVVKKNTENNTENNTLVYNEQAQAFTSVYTFAPIYYCNLNGKMIVTKQWDEDAGLYEYNSSSDNSVMLFEEEAKPLLKYTVNKDASYNKVFDIQTFGGRFYKGDTTPLKFEYKTPLKQRSHTDGTQVTDREYDFRLAIPRNNDDMYGGRMRGKTIECTINSDSNDYDFSIQYITTKYRMSWS